MSLFRVRYLSVIFPFILLISVQAAFAQEDSGRQPLPQKKEASLPRFNSRFGKNDTIWSQVIIYDGDTIPAKSLASVDVIHAMSRAMRRRMEAMTRLRNAVYVNLSLCKKSRNYTE